MNSGTVISYDHNFIIYFTCKLNLMTISLFSIVWWVFTIKTNTDRLTENYIYISRHTFTGIFYLFTNVTSLMPRGIVHIISEERSECSRKDSGKRWRMRSTVNDGLVDGFFGLTTCKLQQNIKLIVIPRLLVCAFHLQCRHIVPDYSS